jgi:hypothetical protein
MEALLGKLDLAQPVVQKLQLLHRGRCRCGAGFQGGVVVIEAVALPPHLVQFDLGNGPCRLVSHERSPSPAQ